MGKQLFARIRHAVPPRFMVAVVDNQRRRRFPRPFHHRICFARIEIGVVVKRVAKLFVDVPSQDDDFAPLGRRLNWRSAIDGFQFLIR